MILYALACEHGHEFEGWFGSSADYDDQASRGLLACPVCASRAVTKQIMAPSVVGAKKRGELAAGGGQKRQMMMEAMAEVRRHVEDNFDYVGDTFAREARDIHEGRSEQRGIYGETTPEQAEALADEGIEVNRIPWVPRADG